MYKFGQICSTINVPLNSENWHTSQGIYDLFCLEKINSAALLEVTLLAENRSGSHEALQ